MNVQRRMLRKRTD